MKLERELDQREMPYRKIQHRLTFTSEALAREAKVSGFEVAKPVIVRGKRGFAMCVLAAPDRLDLDRAAELLDEDNLRLATEDELKTLFPDCEVGAEPPIGSLYGLPTVVDRRLLKDERLLMQAGTHREAVRMRLDDWEQLSHPIVGCITTSDAAVPSSPF